MTIHDGEWEVNQTMREVTFISPSERLIYQEYERQRRLRLTLRVAPVFGILLAILFVAATIFLLLNTHINRFLYLAYELLGVCVTLFGVGTFAARRKEVNLAAGSVGIASSLAIITVYLAWALLTHHLDPFLLGGLASFDLAIVLVGILGERWMVIVTTLLMNGFTILLLAVFGVIVMPAPIDPGQLPFVGLQGIVQQWCFAALLLSVNFTYRRTLRELGDTRVAYERAKQLDTLKEQFITNVNHELRNPIMALQGCVEILALVGDTLPTEERAMLFDQARRAGDDLVALLTSILDTRRLDEGTEPFTPEPVNLRSAIEDATHLLDPQAGQWSQRPLHLSIPPDLAILGEPVRLRQILTNLLSNAIKYSDPGSPVAIAAHTLPAASHAATAEPAPHRLPSARSQPGNPSPLLVEIQVRDYGLGVPPDQIPLLFQRFVRLPRDLGSNITGNGLGLHLCRVLVESMGGTIWVESAGIPGEGSIFIMRLPMAPAERDGNTKATKDREEHEGA